MSRSFYGRFVNYQRHRQTGASKKTGTFCVCPLCVTSHIHSPRNSLPLLKSQMSHQHSPALGHPGHPPVCSSTSYSATDPRRFHCLSLGASENGHIQNGKRMRTAFHSTHFWSWKENFRQTCTCRVKIWFQNRRVKHKKEGKGTQRSVHSGCKCTSSHGHYPRSEDEESLSPNISYGRKRNIPSLRRIPELKRNRLL
uniref:Homeobox domain-containing protein n=1 Tax=Erpetoichthys calabaricus TaxID=27687 RepID=A0A8C4SL38_ERPCA